VGVPEEFEAAAINEAVARQIEKAMTGKKPS
jgi:hypothetical protein